MVQQFWATLPRPQCFLVSPLLQSYFESSQSKLSRISTGTKITNLNLRIRSSASTKPRCWCHSFAGRKRCWWRGWLLITLLSSLFIIIIIIVYHYYYHYYCWWRGWLAILFLPILLLRFKVFRNIWKNIECLKIWPNSR